jgi:hypothetical protein
MAGFTSTDRACAAASDEKATLPLRMESDSQRVVVGGER